MRNKGFTLIELLIVIAILGVLAAVILVAIDPLEQIARGRDAGKKSAVGQLGHAVTAWATAQSATNIYPVIGDTAGATTLAAGNWQTWLVATGEIKAIIANTATTVCSGGTSAESGYCYINSAPDMLIWAVEESKSEKSKAGCTAAQTAVAVYDSSQGKAGSGCVLSAATAPTAGLSLK